MHMVLIVHKLKTKEGEKIRDDCKIVINIHISENPSYFYEFDFVKIWSVQKRSEITFQKNSKCLLQSLRVII